MKYNHNKTKGFTLIELLVSLSVFIVVFVICAGAIVSILGANRKAQSLKLVMNNLNIAIESMVIDLRFGQDYYCGTDLDEDDLNGYDPNYAYSNCTDLNTNSIIFTERVGSGKFGNYVLYYIGTDPNSNKSRIYRRIKGARPVPVTSRDVDITSFLLNVTGVSSGDKLQPRILMNIKGKAGAGDEESDFDIQTTVSQRLLDL